MLRFADTIYLWLLLFIPVLTALMALAEWHRRRMLKRLGDADLVKALMPMASTGRRWTKFILVQIVLAIVILMLARPQMGTKVSNEKREGIEAIIALDISNSMLAEDVAPSRLQKSKMLIENLVDHFTKDKIGLIVFAGDAYVQLPITSDYVSAKMFLQNIDPSLIQTQGTDIAEALDLASNSFTQQQNVGKAIIVITDGEDHEGGAMEAAKEAMSKGYKVFILGIGNTSGAPIPVNGSYLTDNSGNTVMTALNEQMCKDIAQAGNGTYIHVDNTSAAQEALNDELAKLQHGEMESVIYSEYNEQFQIFGIIAIVFIIIEVCISEAVNPWFQRFNLFGKKGRKSAAGTKRMLLFALLMGCTLAVSAQNDRSHIRSGNRILRGGAQDAAQKAEVEYRKALTENNGNSQAMYNLGCALLLQQKEKYALDAFEQAAQMEPSKVRRAMSYHNIGVIMQKQQQYDQAIEAYKMALRLRPDREETRYNLVLCQKLKKDNDKNGGGNQNNQDNKDKDQNKDKNKNDKDKNKDQDNKDDKNKDQNKDKKDQNDKNQNNKDKQDKNNNGQNKDGNNRDGQQPQGQQMSKENAEQLLNAAMQNEKATQQRMKEAMRKAGKKQLNKNW